MVSLVSTREIKRETGKRASISPHTCGQVVQSEHVFRLYRKALERYKVLSTNSNPAQQNCCRILTYKYNLIKRNLSVQLGKPAPAVAALRALVQFELEEKYALENQNAAYLLPTVLGKDFETQLETSTDAEIWNALTFERDRDFDCVRAQSCFCPGRYPTRQ